MLAAVAKVRCLPFVHDHFLLRDSIQQTHDTQGIDDVSVVVGVVGLVTIELDKVRRSVRADNAAEEVMDT